MDSDFSRGVTQGRQVCWMSGRESANAAGGIDASVCVSVWATMPRAPDAFVYACLRASDGHYLIRDVCACAANSISHSRTHTLVHTRPNIRHEDQNKSFQGDT